MKFYTYVPSFVAIGSAVSEFFTAKQIYIQTSSFLLIDEELAEPGRRCLAFDYL